MLAFSFNGLHRRVDKLVDRVFFRQRYNAERRLKLAARSVLHAASAHAVRECLVDELYAALRLSSAALFESGDGLKWIRTRAIGWPKGTIEELGDDDVIVRRVLAEEAASSICKTQWATTLLPVGLAEPVLAVPVPARGRVLAIALYGQHRSGTDIDAEGIAEIERVAEAAAAAGGEVASEIPAWVLRLN